jgi:hypothetical protein
MPVSTGSVPDRNDGERKTEHRGGVPPTPRILTATREMHHPPVLPANQHKPARLPVPVVRASKSSRLCSPLNFWPGKVALAWQRPLNINKNWLKRSLFTIIPQRCWQDSDSCHSQGVRNRRGKIRSLSLSEWCRSLSAGDEIGGQPVPDIFGQHVDRPIFRITGGTLLGEPLCRTRNVKGCPRKSRSSAAPPSA